MDLGSDIWKLGFYEYKINPLDSDRIYRSAFLLLVGLRSLKVYDEGLEMVLEYHVLSRSESCFG